MEGQLSLFSEEQKTSAKAKKTVEKKPVNLSQKFDERMKRFWHYMETKGMNEQWIETAPGELRIIIDALADYCDIISGHVRAMETGYPKAVLEQRLDKIQQIRVKLEESIRYSRDRQIEKCMKRRFKKESDIGEDALALITRRVSSAEEEKNRIEGDDMIELTEGGTVR